MRLLRFQIIGALKDTVSKAAEFSTKISSLIRTYDDGTNRSLETLNKNIREMALVSEKLQDAIGKDTAPMASDLKKHLESVSTRLREFPLDLLLNVGKKIPEFNSKFDESIEVMFKPTATGLPIGQLLKSCQTELTSFQTKFHEPDVRRFLNELSLNIETINKNMDKMHIGEVFDKIPEKVLVNIKEGTKDLPSQITEKIDSE
eukprot:TRINITY_DN29029_c0_g1_i2.p1 TRINITY_DN29029_c0_g1~~TRINITY_DN29029_c0_g1_i2.p1  ORF type:complete len:203 (+),score=30.66 TRINITY_DN29029_c0_g1_i2:117-725(+)